MSSRASIWDEARRDPALLLWVLAAALVLYVFITGGYLIAVLHFAAIYAIYLFYLGVGPVMKTPADKVIPYMLLSALAIIVVWIILGLLMAAMGFISGGYGGMF